MFSPEAEPVRNLQGSGVSFVEPADDTVRKGSKHPRTNHDDCNARHYVWSASHCGAKNGNGSTKQYYQNGKKGPPDGGAVNLTAAHFEHYADTQCRV